jgi:hypothetical protein
MEARTSGGRSFTGQTSPLFSILRLSHGALIVTEVFFPLLWCSGMKGVFVQSYKATAALVFAAAALHHADALTAQQWKQRSIYQVSDCKAVTRARKQLAAKLCYCI